MTELKATRVLVFIFALLLGVFAIVSFNLIGRIDDQQLAYSALRAENESLRRDVEFATAEIAELVKQRDEANEELSKALIRAERLKRANLF